MTLGLMAYAPMSEAAEITASERGPHHTLWQRVTQHTTPRGRTYHATNSYQEIGTAKNYLKDGRWVPAVEEISIRPSGFFDQTAKLGNDEYVGESHIV